MYRFTFCCRAECLRAAKASFAVQLEIEFACSRQSKSLLTWNRRESLRIDWNRLEEAAKNR